MPGIRSYLTIMILLLLCCFSPAQADNGDTSKDQTQKSSYIITTSVIGTAGSRGGSDHYRTNGTLGQPTSPGIGSYDHGTLCAGFWSSTIDLSGLTAISESIPLIDRLYQNYPNPFNPMTTIYYSVAHVDRVRILVFDVRGSLVVSLVDGISQPGRYHLIWNGRGDTGKLVSSGLYFYHMQIGTYQSTQKMMLLK